MPITRRSFLATSAAAAAGAALWNTFPAAEAEAQQMFQPTWDSLRHYNCPEWFRDAKFGIWAHWDAQCVPEQGGWYARGLYQQHNAESWSTGDYPFQCTHYGHPSKVGMKDVDNIWKAERWDPEYLINLYKAAGAKYFCALANHHDNFDTWNSKHQPWNAVNIGPKRDILGTWAKVARSHGLPFGVSVHCARTWDWFDVSHQSDTTGPLAGVPYDGNMTSADGVGKWWEGYDPADLYCPAGKARTAAAHAAYELKFYNRVIDLLDQHKPELLYFDDGDLPTAYGMQIAADFYNKSMQWNGKLNAVLNTKGDSSDIARSMVRDYERGQSSRIQPHPWQGETCIGDWHYRYSIYANNEYKTPDQVIKMLVDIVSKNGNLLLSIPLRGDGTIDNIELAFLLAMASWMKVNQESIFSTRPWSVFGEGLVNAKGGGFSEGVLNFTSSDFRFTTRGNTLYATALGWPLTGKYTIRTLAASSPYIVGEIKNVELLGHGPVRYEQTSQGLVVTVPDHKPCEHAWVLKITGLDLVKSRPAPMSGPPPTTLIAPVHEDITLKPDDAALDGTLHVQDGSKRNIGFWNDPLDSASWLVRFDGPGTYLLTAEVAMDEGVTAFTLGCQGTAPAVVTVLATGGWNTFKTVQGGLLKITSSGEQIVTAKPLNPDTWHPINLASITLTRQIK